MKSRVLPLPKKLQYYDSTETYKVSDKSEHWSLETVILRRWRGPATQIQNRAAPDKTTRHRVSIVIMDVTGVATDLPRVLTLVNTWRK